MKTRSQLVTNHLTFSRVIVLGVLLFSLSESRASDEKKLLKDTPFEEILARGKAGDAALSPLFWGSEGVLPRSLRVPNEGRLGNLSRRGGAKARPSRNRC